MNPEMTMDKALLYKTAQLRYGPSREFVSVRFPTTDPHGITFACYRSGGDKLLGEYLGMYRAYALMNFCL